jgi:hypothetical protein
MGDSFTVHTAVCEGPGCDELVVLIVDAHGVSAYPGGVARPSCAVCGWRVSDLWVSRTSGDD